MKILLTGGTGYIGSHTAIELIEAGYEVSILDNLFNSKIEVLDKIEEITGIKPEFFEVDLLDRDKVFEVFRNNKFDLVIHFAGLKAVSESVDKPLLYYRTNVGGSINLLDAMQEYGINRIIFSSSATVYGDPGDPKYVETMETGHNLANPYGRTKYMIEEIIKDTCNANPEFGAVLLRYFNPIGNHESGLIGEDPNGIPNNLMPIIMQVLRGERDKLSIYGNDYPTPDGTCLRDYIHVVDLARGHMAVIDQMHSGVQIFNLGSGQPHSVLEIVGTLEKISGDKLPIEITGRRSGDLAEFYADPTKAREQLGWKTKLTVEDAIKSILKFVK